MSLSSRHAMVAVMGLTMVLTACHDTTDPAIVDTPARAYGIVGVQQTLPVGTPTPDSLAVVVYGASGDLLPGTVVQWTIVSGRGRLSAATSTTNAQGIARIGFTADTLVGNTVVRALAGTSVAVDFEQQAVAGIPSRLVALQPASDSLMAGEVFSAPMVHVVDRYGNSVSGVTFQVAVRDAVEGDALAESMVTTGADGVASMTFTPTMVPGWRFISFTTADGLTVSYAFDVLMPESRRRG